MVSRLRDVNIDEGQLRLLTMIANVYSVSPESILNQLVLDYNEMHMQAVISKSVYDTTLGVSLGVVEVGEALAKKSNEEWLKSLKSTKNPTVKVAKEEQIKTIEESL